MSAELKMWWKQVKFKCVDSCQITLQVKNTFFFSNQFDFFYILTILCHRSSE